MVVFTVLFLNPPSSLAGLKDSAHDFSDETWSGAKICNPCHTPHNTTGTTPLWSHEVTTAEYTLYDTPTEYTPAEPGKVSKLCLSCHDGTLAIDAYSGRSGTEYISGLADLDTDLADDHPIGVLWMHQTVGDQCGL
jgi:hypothetical protein